MENISFFSFPQPKKMTVPVGDAPLKASPSSPRLWTRKEVESESQGETSFIIIDGGVYEITNWIFKHPGGRVIRFLSGQDATETTYAFHSDMQKVRKFMAPLHVGDLHPDEYLKKLEPEISEFRQLREKYEEQGLFRPNIPYYLSHLFFIILFEVIGIILAAYHYPFYLPALFLGISQTQAGWNQVSALSL